MMRNTIIALVISLALFIGGCGKKDNEGEGGLKGGKTSTEANANNSGEGTAAKPSSFKLSRLLCVEGERPDRVVFDQTGDYVLAVDGSSVLYCSVPQNRILLKRRDHAHQAAFSLKSNELILAMDEGEFPLHIWKRNTGKKMGNLNIAIEPGLPVGSFLVDYRDKAYYHNMGGLFKYDGDTGKLIWRIDSKKEPEPLGPRMAYVPGVWKHWFIGDQIVIMGVRGHMERALDGKARRLMSISRSSGTLNWTVTIPGKTSDDGVAVCPELGYIVTLVDFKFGKYDLKTGKHLATVPYKEIEGLESVENLAYWPARRLLITIGSVEGQKLVLVDPQNFNVVGEIPATLEDGNPDDGGGFNKIIGYHDGKLALITRYGLTVGELSVGE